MLNAESRNRNWVQADLFRIILFALVTQNGSRSRPLTGGSDWKSIYSNISNRNDTRTPRIEIGLSRTAEIEKREGNNVICDF